MTASAPRFPAFFEAAPTLHVADPLAAFLGAAQEGVLEYRYADVVRFAGHSCPTVASAFLATRAALRALYPDTLPRRGEVRVELRDAIDEGVTGVMGSVAGLLTGAAGAGGFHGIAGRFVRKDLLAFGVPMHGQLRFTRVDTGAAVEVSIALGSVPGDPRAMQLMPRCVQGVASAGELAEFGAAWQERVRRLLLEHADDPAVIALEPVAEGALHA